MMETMDERFGNNNQGIPDDPQLLFLFQKKRHQEDMNKINKAVIINSKPQNRNMERRNINNNNNINNININDDKNKKEETIPLDEGQQENENRENVKTKRKGPKDNKKKEDKEKKVDSDLYNKLSNLMSTMNKKRKRK